MQVLVIFFEKTLDKYNDQALLEFKMKVNNDSAVYNECVLI